MERRRGPRPPRPARKPIQPVHDVDSDSDSPLPVRAYWHNPYELRAQANARELSFARVNDLPENHIGSLDWQDLQREDEGIAARALDEMRRWQTALDAENPRVQAQIDAQTQVEEEEAELSSRYSGISLSDVEGQYGGINLADIEQVPPTQIVQSGNSGFHTSPSFTFVAPRN